MSLKKRKRAEAENRADGDANDLKTALLLERRENFLLKAEIERVKSLIKDNADNAASLRATESAESTDYADNLRVTESSENSKNCRVNEISGGANNNYADNNNSGNNKGNAQNADNCKKQSSLNDINNLNSDAESEELAVFSEDCAKKSAKCADKTRGACDVAPSEEVAARRIRLEMDRLRMFVLKWQAAFSGGEVQRNYEKSLALVNALKSITEKNYDDSYDLDKLADRMRAAEKIISAPYAALSETAATEDCFDLNEVINPSEKLDLEKLCKELGVME